MLCTLCQRPASGECVACGVCYCSDHGGERCFRCGGPLAEPRPGAIEIPEETAIYTTDKTSRYSGKGYLQSYGRAERKTIYLDDPEPPACYQCSRLARQICSNCQQLFCSQHQGGKSLCRDCGRSSWLGVAVFLATALFLASMMLLSFWLR